MIQRKSVPSFLLVFVMIGCLCFPAAASAEGSSEPIAYEKPFVRGDVDGDGVLTAVDARLILRAASGLVYMSDISWKAADYDGDNMITAVDARIVLRFSAGLAADEPEPEPEPEPSTSKFIQVNTLCQYPEYPTGCEAVSAVMALQYYGFQITVDQFIDGYLSLGTAPYRINGVWYGSDPDVSFLGSPTDSKSWGIWAPGLCRALQRFFDNQPDYYAVSYTYSESLDSLCERYIVNDMPVLVWATADMKSPRVNATIHVIGSDKTYTWISPNHCLLLVGFDETGYYFNDPITGECEKYGREKSIAAFTGNGSQAVIIEKK